MSHNGAVRDEAGGEDAVETAGPLERKGRKDGRIEQGVMAGTPIYLLRVRPLPFLAAAARFHSHTFLRALDYYPRQKHSQASGFGVPNARSTAVSGASVTMNRWSPL